MKIDEADPVVEEAGTSTSIETIADHPDEEEEMGEAAGSSERLAEQQEGQQQLEQVMEEVREHPKRKSLAFLSHNESLRRLLGKIGPPNCLTSWTDDDCAGLLVQLTKHMCDEEGAKRMIRFFRDTTPDEILECFNTCKAINKRAKEGRAPLDDFINAEPAPTAPNSSADSQQEKGDVPPPLSWPALLMRAKKSRTIPDQSSIVVANYLLDCSLKSDPINFADHNAPDYGLIYSHLASMVQGYTLKGIRAIDASVLLEIFGDLEREIDSKPGLVNFFKQMHADLQHFSKEEFKLDEELTEENVGQKLMNTLDLPDDLLDLSRLYPTTDK